MRNWRVGIVGGGPGGLMTAYLLQKLASEPFSVSIFEASPRLGGKVLTKPFSLTDARYEAGAAELYDYSPVGEDPLRELVAELGLPTTPMRGSSVIINHRVLSNLDDIDSHLGAPARIALSDFDNLARDRITPGEFYHSGEHAEPGDSGVHSRFNRLLDSIPDPAARRYVETLIHSDLATEPEQTSVTYGLHNYLMNHPAYMQLYCIDGGNERLTSELSARIRADKQLLHTVTRIGRGSAGRLTVDSVHKARTRQDEFDFVVIAVPQNCLSSITFDGDRLSAAVSRHRAHYDHPAHYLRVTALFETAFWSGAFDDAYCMLDQFGGCCLYDESSRVPGSRHAALGWLIGGNAAKAMSEWGDAELIDAVLGSLPDFLVHGRQQLLEAHVHRWVGAVSALPGGERIQSIDCRHQPEPVEHPNLFFVGDYMSDSTLNGVLDSADHVARWIAANLSECSTGDQAARFAEPMLRWKADASVVQRHPAPQTRSLIDSGDRP